MNGSRTRVRRLPPMQPIFYGERPETNANAMTESNPARPPDATPPQPRAIPAISDHTPVRIIGEGSGGQVWLARNVLGTYRAIKVVYASSFRHRRPFDRELNGILKFEPVSRLHDGLVDILQVGHNEASGYF